MSEGDDSLDEEEQDQTQYGGDLEGESAVEQTHRRTDDQDEDEGVEGDQGRDPEDDEYGQDETDPA